MSLRAAAVQMLAKARSASGLTRMVARLRKLMRAERLPEKISARAKSVISARWHLQPPRQRQCRGIVSRGARVRVVVAHTVSGLGLCISGRQVSVALCHAQLRRSSKVNEVTLVASAVPSVKLLPKEFRAAVGALPAGRRALVCAFRTDQRPDFAVYHGRAQEQPDQVYRKARDDDTKTWTDSHDRVWARRAKVRGISLTAIHLAIVTCSIECCCRHTTGLRALGCPPGAPAS